MSKRERWSDDLMWSLACAISDATDCDGLSEDTLRDALETHGLAVVPAAALTDPITVHANMLRGTIANPSIANIIHLYGREALLEALVPDLILAAKEAAVVVSAAAKAAGADPMGGTCLPRLMAAIAAAGAQS